MNGRSSTLTQALVLRARRNIQTERNPRRCLICSRSQPATTPECPPAQASPRATPLGFVVVSRIKLKTPKRLQDALLLAPLHVFSQRRCHRVFFGPVMPCLPRLLDPACHPTPGLLPCVDCYTWECVKQR